MATTWTCLRPRAASIVAAARPVESPGVSRGLSLKRVAASASSSSSPGSRRGFGVDVDARRSLSFFSSSLLRLGVSPPSSFPILSSMDTSSKIFKQRNLLSQNPARFQYRPLLFGSRNYHNIRHRTNQSHERYYSRPSSLSLSSSSSSGSTEKKIAICISNGENGNGSVLASSRAHADDEINAASTTTSSQHYHHHHTTQQKCQPIPSEPINITDNNGFIYSILPPSLHPYARLSRIDKPIGTFLLLHPCLWSVALASSSASSSTTTNILLPTIPTSSSTSLLDDDIVSNTTTTAADLLPVLLDASFQNNAISPFLSLCTTFALGSFIMRSAGCTINDMWDASYDKSVERTKRRPLACGEITHARAAQFLLLQLGCGLCVLLSLPHVEECVLWGSASLPLVVAYPLMKRYTNFPQVVLGMTFNWGAILGWVAVRGGGMNIDWTVVGPLYVAGIAWTVVYDTLYAHQDKKDDAKLGLKSTALTFGDRWTKPILTGCTAITWGGWMMAGYKCGFGTEDAVALTAFFEQDSVFNATTTAAFAAQYAYYAGVSAAATHMLWQIYTADLNDASNLAYRFKSNNLVGWIVFGSCCVAAGGSNVVLAAI